MKRSLFYTLMESTPLVSASILMEDSPNTIVNRKTPTEPNKPGSGLMLGIIRGGGRKKGGKKGKK